jgi:N-acetylglucosamine kinase-like BadF-type ATPase
MLTGALVAHLGARDVEEMIEGIALGRYELGAGAAPLVFGAAHAGDPVARDVIAWAGRELGSLAVGVIHQLSFEALSFDVVLVGRVFHGGPLLVEPLCETVHAVAPGARLLRLTAPPVTGAVLLGMPRSGHDRAALRETLLRTTSHLLHKPGAQEPPDGSEITVVDPKTPA